ncbi:MAG: FAD:protein FMN transferase [Rubrivivax sp.]|nr:FAD:protein FMN transferase [Rubrivivax sp.]
MLHQLQAVLRKRLRHPFMRSLWMSDTDQADLQTTPEGCWWHQDAVAMGSTVTLDLWADDQAEAAQAAAEVMRVLQRVDETMNAQRPFSEVARINRDAAHGSVPISDELFRLLQRALKLAVATRGAFDITYTASGRPLDAHTGTIQRELHSREVLPGIGSSHVELDEWTQTVRFRHRATHIDLAGLARAHAVDQAALRLKRLGIQHACLSAGGDSRVIGDRRGRPWSLGIRDPHAENELVAVLPLTEVSVSSSGDHERSLHHGGRRIRRLIDPRTGQPAHDTASVTVLAADGVTAEAASKMLFALGAGQGLARLPWLPGVEAVVISADGELHATAGLDLRHATELGRPVDRSLPSVQ